MSEPHRHPHPHEASRPALRGALLALLAAALFGLSTPLIQRWGAGMGAFSTAALLYAGAALVGLLSLRGASREARVRTQDMGRLLAMAAFGAVIGPVALAWGLQRTSGASASLLLALEAVFTAVLAWAWYRESMDRRVWAAVLLLVAGGMVLVLEQGLAGSAQLLGLLSVGLATAAWGVDNTLSRGVADRDPGQVVAIKALLGCSATALIAWVSSEPLPSLWAALGLLAVGASGYGLSLRLYLLAQRSFGAARTGSVFAFAPFIGALAAFALGERAFSLWFLLAGSLMLLGVWLHLAEDHGHEHAHEALEHEHAHHHSDGHHTHTHDPMPTGAHSHPHAHAPLRHSHAHVPDLHHQHGHG
jgi:drug/metabolite transporter (DMT)-like permease